MPEPTLSMNPYLTFGGRCKEAIDFYVEKLGATVAMSQTFGESPYPMPEDKQFPGWQDHIMHAVINFGPSMLMMSDGWAPTTTFEGFRLSLNARSDEEAERLFNGLAAEGTIDMPLAETFWTSKFGMVTDKFGVGWMVSVWTEH